MRLKDVFVLDNISLLSKLTIYSLLHTIDILEINYFFIGFDVQGNVFTSTRTSRVMFCRLYERLKLYFFEIQTP